MNGTTTNRTYKRGRNAAAGTAAQRVRINTSIAAVPPATDSTTALTPASAYKPVAPTYKILGKGSFGAVIQPALPNRASNTEPWTEYPGNVTKIFYKRRDFEKALEAQKTAFTIFADKAEYRANTYAHPYKRSNLPPEITAIVEPEITKVAAATQEPAKSAIMSNGALLMRVPYLGVSFQDIIKQNLKSTVRPIVLHQIADLYRHVAQLVRNGYIHGDLHTGNILINTMSGVMTIVDFDWLKPVAQFFNDYYNAFGHMTNPPETLLVPAATAGLLKNSPYTEVAEFKADMYKRNPATPAIPSTQQVLVNQWLAYHNGIKWPFIVYGRVFTDDDIMPVLMKFYNKTLTEPRLFGNTVRETFDSFMMSSSLMYFLRKAFLLVFRDTPDELIALTQSRKPGESVEYITMMFNLLRRMMTEVIGPSLDIDAEARMRPDEATRKATDIFNEYLRTRELPVATPAAASRFAPAPVPEPSSTAKIGESGTILAEPELSAAPVVKRLPFTSGGDRLQKKQKQKQWRRTRRSRP